jgi:hypothetical protein
LAGHTDQILWNNAAETMFLVLVYETCREMPDVCGVKVPVVGTSRFLENFDCPTQLVVLGTEQVEQEVFDNHNP